MVVICSLYCSFPAVDRGISAGSIRSPIGTIHLRRLSDHGIINILVVSDQLTRPIQNGLALNKKVKIVLVFISIVLWIYLFAIF